MSKKEHKEVLRRIAERGLALAQSGIDEDVMSWDSTGEAAQAHRQHIDIWQHMLDELERLYD
jgi:hypothetical protein